MTDLTLSLFPPPVSTGEVEKPYRISHSQLGVFQNCQQAWWYGYVDDLIPKETKGYFRRGTLIHEQLSVYDQLLQQGLRPGSREALEMVLEFASGELSPHLSGDELADFTRATAAVTRFIKDFSPKVDEFITIKGVEEYFEITLRTPKGRLVSIEGYMDRIYSQQGNLWVLDRKSTSTGKHYKENEIIMDNQLTTYAAVLRLMGYDVFGVAIDSINTYPYKEYHKEPVDKLFKRIQSYRSEREMAFSLRNYLRAADAKIDLQESGEQPLRRLTRDCVRCQYCDLCTYEMKGISTEMLLSEKFRLKEKRVQKFDETKTGLRLRYHEDYDTGNPGE